MATNINRFIYWTPRILSIMFICFLALFSLDVISPQLSFWQIVVGLLMHNIPVFVLLAALLISWKYEIVGGVVFIAAGAAYVGWILVNILKDQSKLFELFWTLPIAGPAFLIGILFIINWLKKNDHNDAPIQ